MAALQAESDGENDGIESSSSAASGRSIRAPIAEMAAIVVTKSRFCARFTRIVYAVQLATAPSIQAAPSRGWGAAKVVSPLTTTSATPTIDKAMPAIRCFEARSFKNHTAEKATAAGTNA